MINHTVQYENLDGGTSTAAFQFHLSAKELAELDMFDKQDRIGEIQRRMKMLEANQDAPNFDRDMAKALQDFMTIFEEICLAAYGVRDGEDYFEKSDDLRHRFTRHAAYSDFLYGFVTDTETASVFLEGIMPAKLMKSARDIQNTTASEQARARSEAQMQGYKQAQPAAPQPTVLEKPSAPQVPGATPLPADWSPEQGVPQVSRSNFETASAPSYRPDLTPEQIGEMSPAAIAAYYKGQI